MPSSSHQTLSQGASESRNQRGEYGGDSSDLSGVASIPVCRVCADIGKLKDCGRRILGGDPLFEFLAPVLESVDRRDNHHAFLIRDLTLRKDSHKNWHTLHSKASSLSPRCRKESRRGEQRPGATSQGPCSERGCSLCPALPGIPKQT